MSKLLGAIAEWLCSASFTLLFYFRALPQRTVADIGNFGSCGIGKNTVRSYEAADSWILARHRKLMYWILRPQLYMLRWRLQTIQPKHILSVKYRFCTHTKRRPDNNNICFVEQKKWGKCAADYSNSCTICFAWTNLSRMIDFTCFFSCIQNTNVHSIYIRPWTEPHILQSVRFSIKFLFFPRYVNVEQFVKYGKHWTIAFIASEISLTCVRSWLSTEWTNHHLIHSVSLDEWRPGKKCHIFSAVNMRFLRQPI